MTVPEIGDFSARQLENAKIILAAALPFGTEAAVASLMAAAAESSFLRYANNGRTTRPDVEQKWRDLAALSLQFEHDAVAGEADTTADSIGCFQQRLKYGYSTPDRNGVAELMDPAAATRIFVRGSFGGTGKTRFFLEAPTDRSLAARVQWTQGSEFRSGENYAPFQHVAEQIVATQHALTPTEPEWFESATLADVAQTLQGKDRAVTTPAEVKKAFQDALTESELLDKVIKSLPARRIHFWDNNNLLADHYIADIDAGTYSAVPASAIGVVWGIQKSILGNQAKDWLEIGYSAGNAGADMRYFGQRVDQYESLR